MWAKGIFLIIFALLIDGAQILVGWMFVAIGLGLQVISPVGGALGGAAAGAYLCWDSSGGIVAAIASAAQCAIAGAGLGAAASAFGVPLGAGMGFIIDICISLTAGSGLILALFLCGMFDIKSVGAVFVGEAIPGLDVLPGWTLLVIRSILKKNAEETIITRAAMSLGAGAVSPTNATGLGMLTAGFSTIKNNTGAMVRRSPRVENTYDSDPVQEIARERTQLKSDVGREINTRPTRNTNDTTNQFHAKTV